MEVLGSLFQQPVLTVATLIQIFSWYILFWTTILNFHFNFGRFVNSAAYYGLTLAAGSSGGGLCQATALSGAVEVEIEYFSEITNSFQGASICSDQHAIEGAGSAANPCWFHVSGWDRLSGNPDSRPQSPLSCSFPRSSGQAQSCCQLCCCLHSQVQLHKLILIQKCMCSSEIFPTTLRPSAMGLVTVGARLGGILAPFIVMLGDWHENLQFTVFGILSLAAGDSYASRRILWGI